MTQSKTPVSRNAKHILTDEEVDTLKETLLAALQSKKEIEAEKKEVANTYKTKVAEQELAIDKASNLLRVGYEHRPFQCYLVKNFDTGKREYFEYGSDKLIDSEPLNAADYQTAMDIEEAEIKANNEKAENSEDEPLFPENNDETNINNGARIDELASAISYAGVLGAQMKLPVEKETIKKGGKIPKEENKVPTLSLEAEQEEGDDPFDFGEEETPDENNDFSFDI